MEVLVLTPTFYPRVWWAEESMTQLYSWLVEKWVNVHVFTPKVIANSQLWRDSFMGVNIFRFVSIEYNKYSKFISYNIFGFIFLLYFLLKMKKRVDLIHVQYLFPMGLLWVLFSKILRVPIVFSEHHYGTWSDISSYTENGNLINKICAFIFKKSDITVSTWFTQNEFLEYLSDGSGTSKIKEIKLWAPEKKEKTNVDKLLLRKKYNLSTEFVFVSIWRLVKRKKFEKLIELSKHLKKNCNIDFTILILWEGGERSYLEEQIKEEWQQGNIVLLWSKIWKEKEELLFLSDLFLFTSEFEWSWLVYTEANAFWLPVIAFENEAVNSIYKNNHWWIVVKRDIKLMGDEIEKILSDKGLYEDKIKQWYTLLEEYSWNKYSENYFDLFHLILKKYEK